MAVVAGSRQPYRLGTVSFVGSATRRPRGDGICGDKAKPGLCHLSRTLRDKSRTPAVSRTKVAGLGVSQEGMLMHLLLALDWKPPLKWECHAMEIHPSMRDLPPGESPEKQGREQS